MTGRISTAGMHAAAIAQVMGQQSRLAKTQAQVASGHRFDTPAENPIAATQVLDFERSRAALEQYGLNSDLLTSRLNTSEQSLASVENILQRVRELAIQANSGAIDAGSQQALATEIRSRAQELLDIANRRDAGGEYVFAGYASGAQPFNRGPGGVTYAGDAGVRSLQVGATQKIADGFSGAQVFENITEANGTFVTTQGVHTGAGSIDTGKVVNAAAWVRGTYTLTFTAPGTYEVRDATNTLVSSGAYTSGAAIGFNGIEVTVTGTPATNDTFTVSPSGTESLFDTLDALATALTTSGTGPVSRASTNTSIARALAQLDQGLDRVGNLRAEVGARLSTLETTDSDRQALDDQLNSSVSQLRDIDYAEAISRMNQQLTGLQAAQAAYARISQLSLFDYL